MIIITGPGRSGTSALALLYRELGFDPGGGWIPSVRAGFEHKEFWGLNNRLAKSVGATMLHPPKAPASTPTPPPTGYKRIVRGARRRTAAVIAETPPPKPKPSANANGRVRLIDWTKVDQVVEDNRETMVRLARENQVVKDPRFMFTLPLWVQAGAEIDYVVITLRSIGDMIASRHAAGHSEFDHVELRNSLSYGLGVITQTVFENEIPNVVVRFPDFVDDVDGLYDSLRFPEPVSLDRFRETATRVFDPSKVHDWSAQAAPAS